MFEVQTVLNKAFCVIFRYVPAFKKSNALSDLFANTFYNMDPSQVVRTFKEHVLKLLNTKTLHL